jgi:serine/threonine-protein kinase
MAEDRALLNGRYRIGSLLGEGAVGIVSRAWDEVLRRDVAVKMLKPAYASDERTVARFYAEARAAARLAHPHAVLVHDIVADRTWHAIVMEYVAGVSLERVLAHEGRLGEARAVRYGREIAQALAAAHAGGLLHRDVKPSNVLITQDDSVKVADFGLAKAIVDVGTSTEAGRLIGSASYVSPEQAQGLALTPASDLYSLGVVLHRLVTGRLPFAGASPIAVAVAHVTAPAPREDALAREMSPALARIVARLLRKDPAERYASAAELAAALAALETGPARSVAAWDAPTVTAERVRVPWAPRGTRVAGQPAGSSRAPAATRMHRALGIARGTVTALALFVVFVAGVRVVDEHHVTANGLRHLTLRHAAHTALVDLGLRPRPPAAQPASTDIATVESDRSADATGK